MRFKNIRLYGYFRQHSLSAQSVAGHRKERIGVYDIAVKSPGIIKTCLKFISFLCPSDNHFLVKETLLHDLSGMCRLVKSGRVVLLRKRINLAGHGN